MGQSGQDQDWGRRGSGVKSILITVIGEEGNGVLNSVLIMVIGVVGNGVLSKY